MSFRDPHIYGLRHVRRSCTNKAVVLGMFGVMIDALSACKSKIEAEISGNGFAAKTLTVESASARDSHVTLNWSQVTGAASYNIAISSDSECAVVLASKTESAPSRSAAITLGKAEPVLFGCIEAVSARGATIKGAVVKGFKIPISSTESVADLLFSPAEGSFGPAQSVTISTTTSGATIYYTTDGSTPSAASAIYSGPINVTNTQTIKAVGTKTNFAHSQVTAATYTINGAVQTPVATPASNVFSNNVSVALATVPMAASIYYTTDGSTPTSSSSLYTGAIMVTATTTLKALAVMSDYSNSAVMTEVYTMTAATPTADIAAGAYGPGQTVTLTSSTTGAVVRYTTDGSTPTCTSPTGAVSVASSMTVKAIACKTGYTSSAVASFAYIINGAVANPSFSVAAGTYTLTQSVTLSTATNGAMIYYTTDGSTPSTSSNVYSDPIDVPSSMTLKAMATKVNFINSQVVSAAYTIIPTVQTPTFSVTQGTYHGIQTVSVSSVTQGATFYYTTNGSTPTTSSSVYSAPINVGTSLTIKVLGVKAGLANSAIASATYTINLITPSMIEAFPDTSLYPDTTWRPYVKFSIDAADTVGLFSDMLGTAVNSPQAVTSGANLLLANSVTALGQTNTIYAKSTASSDFINLGSYTTKKPISPHMPGVNGGVLVIVKDSVTTGCTVAPYCLIVGGSFTSFAGQRVNNIFRIKSDGAIESLGSGLNGAVTSIVFDSSGNIYVGGSFSCVGGSDSRGSWSFGNKTCSGSGGTISLNKVAKWNGTSWSPLGLGFDDLILTWPIKLATDNSGNIYAAGMFNFADNNYCPNLAMWNGTTWSAVGAQNPNSYIFAIASDNAGNIYIGGIFTQIGTTPANRIAKWNGTSWSALGSGVDFTSQSIIIDSSGNVYAAGMKTSYSSGLISNSASRWNGSSWTSLGTNVDNYSIYSMALSPSGDVYVGMIFTDTSGTSTHKISKWNGTAWVDAAIADQYINTLYFDSGGQLYAGGSFSKIGGTTASGIARLSGTAWSKMADGEGLRPTYDNYSSRSVTQFDIAGNFYVAGDLQLPNLPNTKGVAKWDGTSWTSLASGVDGPINTMVTSSSGQLYIGGNFTKVNNVSANYFARWDGSSWAALGSGFTGDGYSGITSSVADALGNVYVAGSFTTAGVVSDKNIVKWNGSSWTTLATDMTVTALTVDSAGNLYAAGFFDAGGYNLRGKVAKWNGSSWSNLGAIGFMSVKTLAVDTSGNVYAGGSFNCASGSYPTSTYPATSCSGSSGSTDFNNIAKWNGTTWSPLGLGTDGEVWSIVVDSNHQVFVGGRFKLAGDLPMRGLAKWNNTTSAWNQVGSGIDGSVGSLNFDSSGNLFVSGSFDTLGDQLRTNLAKWMTQFDRWF